MRPLALRPPVRRRSVALSLAPTAGRVVSMLESSLIRFVSQMDSLDKLDDGWRARLRDL